MIYPADLFNKVEQLVRHFPRNPERDEKGNAVLYPGFPRYEGVSAIFSDKADGSEFVILAPNIDVLVAVLKEYKIANTFHRTKCRQARMELLPNASAQVCEREKEKTNED